MLKNDQKGFIYEDGTDPRIFKVRPGEHRFVEQMKEEGADQKYQNAPPRFRVANEIEYKK